MLCDARVFVQETQADRVEAVDPTPRLSGRKDSEGG